MDFVVLIFILLFVTKKMNRIANNEQQQRTNCFSTLNCISNNYFKRRKECMLFNL